ncbi:hypothetical protein JXL19_03940 [bacterium]|nr:hypothetical protein [bacterium]
MSLGELAAFVCSYLMKNGTNVVLSGGGCVTIYTKNVYQSCNLDFVENITSGRKRLKKLMSEIGFVEDNKLFKNPENELYIKFPPGPLCIGKEPVRDIVTMEFSTGRLKLLSPTDCVKDRLASYYRWNDKQCLEQAIIVSENIKIDISEIDRWSAQEGKGKEFSSIESMIKDAQKKHSEF